MQLCLWLSPEDAQMHPVPRVSSKKLEQKKEAERGQGSAYKRKNFLKSTGSLTAEPKLLAWHARPDRIRSPRQCSLPTSPLPPALGTPPLPCLCPSCSPSWSPSAFLSTGQPVLRALQDPTQRAPSLHAHFPSH